MRTVQLKITDADIPGRISNVTVNLNAWVPGGSLVLEVPIDGEVDAQLRGAAALEFSALGISGRGDLEWFGDGQSFGNVCYRYSVSRFERAVSEDLS